MKTTCLFIYFFSRNLHSEIHWSCVFLHNSPDRSTCDTIGVFNLKSSFFCVSLTRSSTEPFIHVEVVALGNGSRDAEVAVVGRNNTGVFSMSFISVSVWVQINIQSATYLLQRVKGLHRLISGRKFPCCVHHIWEAWWLFGSVLQAFSKQIFRALPVFPHWLFSCSRCKWSTRCIVNRATLSRPSPCPLSPSPSLRLSFSFWLWGIGGGETEHLEGKSFSFVFYCAWRTSQVDNWTCLERLGAIRSPWWHFDLDLCLLELLNHFPTACFHNSSIWSTRFVPARRSKN